LEKSRAFLAGVGRHEVREVATGAPSLNSGEDEHRTIYPRHSTAGLFVAHAVFHRSKSAWRRHGGALVNGG
jgi:hypothetical protein